MSLRLFECARSREFVGKSRFAHIEPLTPSLFRGDPGHMAPRKIPSLAGYNHKGGTGKTTIIYNIAHFAREHGVQVGAVCLDRQRDLLRMFKGHDKILKKDEVIELKNLLAFYSPDALPDIEGEGLGLLLADCPPARNIAIKVQPTGFLVPINGFNAYENFAAVSRDLIRASDFVLAVLNCAETSGSRDLKDLMEAVQSIPGVEVYPEPIEESGCIARCETQRKPAWLTTHSRRSGGRVQMEKFCRFVLRRLRVKLGPRDIAGAWA